MYKQGDIITCKKDLEEFVGGYPVKMFYKNKEYRIFSLFSDYVLLKNEFNMTSEFSITKNHQIRVRIYLDKMAYYLYDYFYKPDEIRKLKLENIDKL